METFEPEERHATVLFDEMAITPGLQYDKSLSQIVGKPTLRLAHGGETSDETATHALVYMLGGVSTRWKQIVAYDFTGNSVHPVDLYKRITDIITRAHAVGITIQAVISDMGSPNRSLWKMLNIVAGKHCKIRNFVTHPCYGDKKLFFMPDPVHVFKNIAGAFTNGHQFVVDDSIVKQYNLPSNEISIAPIKKVFEIESADVLKLCPKLKHNVIYPSHFERMNVALSVALLNNDVAAGILYYIGEQQIAEKHKTTAWFIRVIFKWFKLMTSRYQKLALSFRNQEEYEENISFLKSVQDIICKTTVNSTWKPFQSGILLSTQTALDFQKIYLEDEKFNYIMLSRLTQDALENTFSTIRSRQPVPDAHMFRVSLRLLCLSQFETNVKRGNYEYDVANSVVQYCDEINKSKQTTSSSSYELNQELVVDLDLNMDMNLQSSIYYLLGAVIHKLKNNFATCHHCFASLITANTSETHVNKFLKLKEYKENVLQYPDPDLFTYVRTVEVLYRQYENQIHNNTLGLADFLHLVQKHPSNTLTVPDCHNILDKLVKLYVRSRIYFSLNNVQTKYCNDKSSRSVAMREALKNKNV